jgi:hypothetical protein
VNFSPPVRYKAKPPAYTVPTALLSPVALAVAVLNSMVPKGDLVDWLTWPADELLRIGGVVGSWFFGKDDTGFTLVQMGFATLVLAAFVALVVFWQALVEYCRSRWKT